MICVLTRQDFLDMVHANPELGVKLSKMMGFRRRVIENRLENMVFRGIPQRLAALLLELKDSFGQIVEGRLKINLPLTHEDLAGLIGAARPTVTEAVSLMKAKGIVATQGKYFFIQDEAGLRRILSPR